MGTRSGDWETSGHMLELKSISKSYGPVRVLDGVDLTLREGEVHAVLGENGAGKSTLMRVAAGLVRPDAGSVLLTGERLREGTRRAFRSAGVEIVTQELTSVPARSVLENVFLGEPVAAVGTLRRSAAAARFQEVCEDAGLQLPPDVTVRELSIADQQILEILRSLIRRPKVLILDEPTSSLDEERARRLLALLQHLASAGVAVAMVSHHLHEVMATATTVSVLRDGRLVSTGPAGSETEQTLIQKMVGRPLQLTFAEKRPPPPGAPIVLQATGVRRSPVVNGVDLCVRAGEIVGLAGLVGAGRSELARCLVGADRRDRGEVRVGDVLLPPRAGPRFARNAGLVMVPEDRKLGGLVLARSVAENFDLNQPRRLGWAGFALPKTLADAAREWIERSDIRPADPKAVVRQLSGGNQQKVLLSKWLACNPKVLIADEPTRGVDVGAKVAIHTVLAETAARGVGILLISSELEELIGLAHRIVVFRQGSVVAEFEGDEIEQGRVIAAAFGATRAGIGS